jgi:hypothetical protein
MFSSITVTSRTARFIIQKCCVVLTLHSCVKYGSQNKQRLLFCATFKDWFSITEVVSVYCAVVTDPVYKQTFFVVKRLSKTVHWFKTA